MEAHGDLFHRIVKGTSGHAIKKAIRKQVIPEKIILSLSMQNITEHVASAATKLQEII